MASVEVLSMDKTGMDPLTSKWIFHCMEYYLLSYVAI